MARSLILAGNRPWGGSSSSWLAWGAAAAVAMGLYVAFGPSTQLSKGQRKKRQRLGYPMGLRNEGNSCFINAILQCLSACEEFHSWLELQAGPQQEQDQMDLVSALLKSIRLINRLDLHPVDQDDFSAVLVLKALRAHGWKFDATEQDAQEFFNILHLTLDEQLTKLNESNSRVSISSIHFVDAIAASVDPQEVKDDPPVADDKVVKSDDPHPPPVQENDEVAAAASVPPSASNTLKRKKHKRRSSGVFSRTGEREMSCDNVKMQAEHKIRPLLSPFFGTCNTRTCFEDNKSMKSPTQAENFHTVTLTLPQKLENGIQITLEALLEHYIAQEVMPDDQSARLLIRQTSIAKLPQCLCLHIQRTGYQGGRAFKREDYIRFEEFLNMGKYIYNTQLQDGKSNHPKTPTIIFKLQSVIEHSGMINSGHYVAFRRGPTGTKAEKKWFKISDTNVVPCDFETVNGTKAYLLFYERTHNISADSAKAIFSSQDLD